MRRALCLLVAVVPLFGGESRPSEYKQRRADLRQSLDGVMVLFGADEPEDLHTSFFQESQFPVSFRLARARRGHAAHS